MVCRAPDATTTCAGTTPTGAQLADDPAGRLASWSGGTTTDSFLYDGAGNRIAQLAPVNGSFTTTTTYVAGGQEEIANNGASATLTTYFPFTAGILLGAALATMALNEAVIASVVSQIDGLKGQIHEDQTNWTYALETHKTPTPFDMR